ncbi:hypothetical protein GCM10010967_19650 [Dyadobacter beijingensis]|uniref:DUF2157 domain-containing protein n=1 Tax=Dyadobacter beijingensis TaxID=365489 RepID=A0ABQ2HQP6_9BACT|nr:DUF2157 domain-containing protein [Dyadobacter beijingensis]GGM87307.1 hypothetical protein GCM10010967_19650 [Dyadobacter beijingensis]
MTTRSILNDLTDKEIISPQQADTIDTFEHEKTFSIHWELRSILYLGILFFSSGAGILIYENIDTIGHQAIIAVIACITAYCYYYTYKNSLPFSPDQVENPNKLVDYVLLLGCSTFLGLEGYLQFQYNIFGSRYGLAVIIPTIIFFVCAYRFDHRGALSMAITGLASWLGLTIAPLSVLSDNDFSDAKLIIPAIALGSLLTAAGWISEEQHFKKHFAFMYMLMGGNLACIAAQIGLFSFEPKILYFFIGIGLCWFFILRARQAQSLLFLLMGTVYGYCILTYVIFTNLGADAALGLGIFYFLFSSVGVIYFLLNFKKFLGIKPEIRK